MSPARRGRAAFALLAALHLLGCLVHFPPGEVFSGEPLLTSDYAWHFLEARRMAASLEERGSLWGYSTVWMAGFPDGLLGLVDNKPFALLLAVVPEGRHPLAFNLAVLACLWIAPILVYPAARLFGQGRREAALAFGLALVAFYGSTLFRLFWRGGSVLFLVSVGVALCLVGLAHRSWTGARPRRIGMAAVGSILPWIHPGGVFVAIPGVLAAWILTLRDRGPRIGEVSAIASIVVAANLPWIGMLAVASENLAHVVHPIYLGGIENLVHDFWTAPFHRGAGPREEVAVLVPLLFAAVLGAPALARQRPRAVLLLAFLAVALASVAYGGSTLEGIAALQPYRFALAAAFVLAVLGGGLVGLDRRAFALVAVVLAIFAADRVRLAARQGDHLGAGLAEVERWALASLESSARGPEGKIDGRVLLEGDWISERVAGRPWAKRVHYAFVGLEGYLDAELLGAKTIGHLVHQSEASFWRGELFGQPVVDLERGALLEALDRYDVRWVVALRPETRRHLENVGTGLRLVAEGERAALFEVERAASRLAAGEGAATSDGRTIRVAVAKAGALVLKYHWIPGLVSEPPVPIGPASGDPASWIRIEAAVEGEIAIALPLASPVVFR